MAENKEIQQIIEQEIRESDKPRRSSRKRKEKKPKNKFKFIAFVEMLLIIVLSGELAWNVFLRDRFTDDKTVPASTDGDSLDPQVRTRPVIEKEETIYQLDGKKILMCIRRDFLPRFRRCSGLSAQYGSACHQKRLLFLH